MAGDCGECTACCRVFAIAEFHKKAGDWCQHCDVGKGCTMYPLRPNPCVDFTCLWLESQKRENPHERLGPDLRPDRCKVVLSATTNPQIMSATTMPGSKLVWRDGNIFKLIKALAIKGLSVVIGPPASTKKVMVRYELGKFRATEVELTEPDETGMQWSKNV